MAGGLVGLLDDIAALAKLAAASIDDVGAAAGRASVKAAGVVVDDAAVTPTYVRGLAAKRELPIIKKIALGSLRNKLLFILPAAMALSAISGKLVEIVLMCGGTYLCFEGAEKLHHRVAGHGDSHGDWHDQCCRCHGTHRGRGPRADAPTVCCPDCQGTVLCSGQISGGRTRLPRTPCRSWSMMPRFSFWIKHPGQNFRAVTQK